jgi:uncharacterized protein (DUF1501 family)
MSNTSNKHMNELLIKASLLFDGEEPIDAAMIAAVCCAWGTFQTHTNPSKRQRNLERMIEFMRTEFKKFEDDEGRGLLCTQ